MNSLLLSKNYSWRVVFKLAQKHVISHIWTFPKLKNITVEIGNGASVLEFSSWTLKACLEQEQNEELNIVYVCVAVLSDIYCCYSE